MAVLTVRQTALAGSTPAPVAAAGGGDSFPNVAGRVMLRVTNGGGSSINVTVNSIQPCDQGSDHDIVVAVPAGATREIGPFTDRFSDTNGRVNVSYSAVTSVTVEPVQVS